MRTFLWILSLALCMQSGECAPVKSGKKKPAPVRPIVKGGPPLGAPAPHFALKTVDGNDWKLSEKCARGPVLLVFFTLSSALCGAELRELKRWSKENPQSSLQVLAISIGSHKANILEAYGKANDLPFAIAIDSGSKVYRSYRGRYVPLNCVVAAKGNVVAVWEGFPLKTGPKRLRTELLPYSGKPPAGT